FALSEVNFSYTGIANTTIIAGKQALATPFTISRDSMGNEQTGTGLVANTNVGPLSLTGGYFNQTNANDGDTGLTIAGEDMYFVAANLTIGGITLDSAYTDLDEQFDAYTLGLSANYDVSGVALNPYARYSSLNLDNSNKDNTLWKVGMSAKTGIFGAYLAYGQTNEEGGIVGIDASSDTGMDDHWRVTLSTVNDASVVYASVNAQVTEKVNLAIKYSDLDAGALSTSKDQNEVYGQATYQMSKNFMTFARFGQYENDGKDYTSGRLHVQYSF
ncbi:porin, partial [Poseidonibacter sp.]|uniref:porin n=1 Tax=Poseidonibacter sp. TaxID=2321188 RepID=UPI003C728253